MGIISFQWLLASVLSFIHPFYISMTEVEQNKNTGTIEISVRIFTDDLENTMRKTSKGKVDLMDKTEKANSEKLLKEYILRHLSLKADGKAVGLTFIGYEAQQGSIWSYFEVPAITSIKTLEITDNILYEYQEQQINFIHIKANNTDETIKLGYPDSYQKFTLN